MFHHINLHLVIVFLYEPLSANEEDVAKFLASSKSNLTNNSSVDELIELPLYISGANTCSSNIDSDNAVFQSFTLSIEPLNPPNTNSEPLFQPDSFIAIYNEADTC